MMIPSMCLAASDKDIQTYTDTDFAMDTVVSQTLYTTGDDINSKLTSVLTDVKRTFFPGRMRIHRSIR